ncbi:DUF4115 domain-containing protein [Paraburkholderia bonniea]|uniref:RodZ domain-containing protein n=1 Tax=Paraburkholderia bonniea TaxID=2152891 RepID=UPI001290B2F6|nr:RodZ domain-containing protein [Paraburkholderia bonniea]WJF91199.1 DUF4115 domain-containing protein [Paraburkholderia bonniea]WJF94513.1 DUF4115 domain-containing protein [Paraburkholderia bonniea]
MSESRPPHDGTSANEDQLTSATGHSGASFGELGSLLAVGSRLTELREAKGWSIDDVSARLKVAAVKLRALEAGDISHLPDTTFALGVVRGYAKMLGADPTPFTQALRREYGVPEPDLSMPASSGKDLPRGRMALSLGGAPRHRSWLWGIAAIFVAMIALAVWHTNGGDSSAWLTRFKASANGAAHDTDAASASVPAPNSAVVAATPGSAADVASAGASSVGSVPGVPLAASTDAAQPVSASSAPLAAPALPSSAAVMGAASIPMADFADKGADVTKVGEAIVSMRVTQDSWFSVRQQDGRELFSGLVRAGEAKEVTGTAPFRITVGNSAGLESISFDGQPVDPAKYSAAKGNVARFALP